MGREYWDCWDTETPATTSVPTTSAPPSSIPDPTPEFVCYPPRIDQIRIGSSSQIEIFFNKG